MTVSFETIYEMESGHTMFFSYASLEQAYEKYDKLDQAGECPEVSIKVRSYGMNAMYFLISREGVLVNGRLEPLTKEEVFESILGWVKGDEEQQKLCEYFQSYF